MAIIGTLLKQGIKLRKSIEQERKSPFALQKRQLLQLLTKARGTSFGKMYDFEGIIHQIQTQPKASKQFFEYFTKKIPIFSYEKIYEEWWYRMRENEEANVTWAGKPRYFALSSGTSSGSTKYLPITADMLKAIQRTSIRQILSLSDFTNIPAKTYSKGILMLGGSTHLHQKGTYFEGDLSGITTKQVPFWFQHFYKPGKRIAKATNWETKLQEITLKANRWDIGYLAGNPAWVQIMMERIIDHYKLKHIHEIWPNLTAYAYGGVSIEPYRKSFDKILGQPITYIETYLASEGFIAFQKKPEHHLSMVLNNGLFYEFIPFNENNFNSDGELVNNPETVMIDDLEEGKNYALLLSTCAGAWRYMIGDTIQLVNKKESEIIITGRTKQFLSLCGEHLSIENMDKAIDLLANELNTPITEYTVAGIPHENLFAHHWFIGIDTDISEEVLSQKIDGYLAKLNDDYRVERLAALKGVFITKIPSNLFYKWMEYKGKMGGQHKFPRVLKKAMYDEWLQFLKDNNISYDKHLQKH
ncbi:MAG: GH3 auxin-responsive promoter [Cytophagales bacterium]|nr:MAG: GH3 auxin-responsive promoter [Cytophagales bacterium]